MKKSKKLMIMGLSAATAAVAATGAVSSFAWFATNDTVTATGMKVKVQSASTLLIDTASATNANGRLATGASTKASGTTANADGIKPASTVNGTDWFTAEAKEADSYDAKDKGYSAIDGNTLKAADYYLASTFYLQTFDSTKAKAAAYDATTKKLVIDSITVTFTTNDLNPSFRVLTVVEGQNTVFSAPTAGSKPTNKGVESVSDGVATLDSITFATSTYDTSTKKATLTADNELIKTVNYNQVYKTSIYLYFDGEDESCKTDNIPQTINDYTVDVSFSLVSNS